MTISAHDDSSAVLARRERQHEAIADLGQFALEGRPLGALFEEAVLLLARCLNVRFVKLLELSPDRTYLTMSAGTGWHPGLVGAATVPADARSQAGFTLLGEETVVVQDFGTETRFQPPELLKDHGIRCGASVIIGPVHDPWGVLGVHESQLGRCAFDLHDIHVIRSVANILWLAIRNQRTRDEVEQERHALRAFADAMPILFSVVDRDGRYAFVNKAYSRFGRTIRKVLGRPVAEVIGAEAYTALEPREREVRSGQVVSFENRITVAGQGQRDVLVTLAPRLASQGDVDGYYAAAVDITAQKQQQRDILQRTQQYRAIADSIPYGIWTCDAIGRLTYVSESFLALTGLSFEEAADFGWLKKLLPEEVEETAQAWNECIARRADWEREHRFMGRDGRTYDLLAIARPTFDETGELTGYVGLNLDITERKRREETLALVSAELDHRVKNVFSLVLTIARQASRHAPDVMTFRQAFEGRLRGLARAHELIAANNWEGMSVRRLIEVELEPYASADRPRWTVEGPDLLLTVEAVQPLALAFHELATNAAKHGAFATKHGTVQVHWSFSAGRGVVLSWKESGLDGLVAPTQAGFGSRVLEQVLVMQLGATVSMDYRDHGLQVQMTLPASLVQSGRE